MEHRGATNIQLLSVRKNTSYVGLFPGGIANKQATVELLPAFRVSILVWRARYRGSSTNLTICAFFPIKQLA